MRIYERSALACGGESALGSAAVDLQFAYSARELIFSTARGADRIGICLKAKGIAPARRADKRMGRHPLVNHPDQRTYGSLEFPFRVPRLETLLQL